MRTVSHLTPGVSCPLSSLSLPLSLSLPPLTLGLCLSPPHCTPSCPLSVALSCRSLPLLPMQMIQAIQVLRFHLLELEKVSASHLALPCCLAPGPKSPSPCCPVPRAPAPAPGWPPQYPGAPPRSTTCATTSVTATSPASRERCPSTWSSRIGTVAAGRILRTTRPPAPASQTRWARSGHHASASYWSKACAWRDVHTTLQWLRCGLATGCAQHKITHPQHNSYTSAHTHKHTDTLQQLQTPPTGSAAPTQVHTQPPKLSCTAPVTS